ncbi:hypothetical protein SUGI_0212570 [Cryptomeria japonica]|nr:hypothetical protein SUGI_0212570 [Cryptomeria japonica]
MLGLQMDYDLDEWKMILATCALLIFMISDIARDIVKDYGKVSWWIPVNLFVLNALTVQILVNVDIEKGNAFSPSHENSLAVLVDKELRVDAARLTTCVFVGCILPGIAMAGTQGKWSNVAALFVSLSFHIASEIYALQNGKNSKVERKEAPWFLSSGVLLLVGASSLLLLLGGVMLTAKMGRHMEPDYISQVLSKDGEIEGDKWETLRRKVIDSWLAVRAWKTGYFVCNSAFSPGAGTIVTICVAVMGSKVACHSSLLHHDIGGGNLTFYLQCVFILMGWVLMLCRWFKAALYCANSLDKGFFINIAIFSLLPAVIVVNLFSPGLVSTLTSFLVNREFKLRSILISVSCVVPLLPLCVLILAICLLWLFCFTCWHFSALIFGSQFVQHLCKRDEKSVLANDEYSKYSSMLHGMDMGEKKQDLFWIVNKKLFDRIKIRMDAGNKMGQRCTGLFSIMGNAEVAENHRLQLCDRNMHSWMGALSRIFSAIADIEISVDLKDALAAYRETQDVVRFVDCPDGIIVDPLNIFGTMNVKSFLESIVLQTTMHKLEKKFKQGLGTSLGAEWERLENLTRGLNGLGQEMFNSQLIRPEECTYYNVEELGEMLRKLVGHVIVSCLLEASDVIVKYTRQWAQNLDEGKIERTVDLAGKVSGLLEKLVEDGHIRLEES